MNRRKLLTNGVAGVAAVIVANAIPGRVHADSDSDSNFLSLIIGSWLGTITIPIQDHPPRQFNDLISFHPGGIVTESRPYSVPIALPGEAGNLLETTGHGAWKQTDENTFEAYLSFLLQHTDTSTPAITTPGIDYIRLSLRLDEPNGTLTGTFMSEITIYFQEVFTAKVFGDFSAIPIIV